MKKKYLLALAIFGCTLLYSQAIKYINTEKLNIRTGPGKNHPVVGTAPLGHSVAVISQSGNWTEIETEDGMKGYASSRFLSSSAPIANNSTKESIPIWKTLLILFALYVVYKIFGGKKSASHSAGSSTNPSSYSSQKKSSSDNAVKSETPAISTSKGSAVFINPSPTPKKNYFCKCCGSDFKSLKTLTAFSCSNSPTGRHQPFEGQESNNYYCKNCGSDFKSLKTLTAFSCSNSPTGRHQPFEGLESNKYYCKNCGSDFRSLKTLTAFSCSKSTTGRHQPAL